MAMAAGYSTGLYTSPHLETVEERLRIDGEPIAAGDLGTLLARVVDLSERNLGNPPTYFEAVTLSAFEWFAERQVDLAVLEVGLGGRLDTTNLSSPLLSLITSISLEHQEYLGDTLAQIAREKAGVFRRDRPALIWIGEEEPATAAAEVAEATGARLAFVDREVEISAIERSGNAGQRVRFSTPVRAYDLEIALAGRHQAHNLAMAVRAAEHLAAIGFDRLEATAIAEGARRCRWPGRLEEIVLPGEGCRAVLDAAHNPEGAAVLARFLAAEPEPVDLLFGVLADKDARRMLAELAPRARRIVFTAPTSARAHPPEDLPSLLPPSFTGEVRIEKSSETALERALEGVGGTLVVCGSIVLVGEIRGLLRRRFGVPGAPRIIEP
jgi:dihydrofolate synthase/folylpolyglutamate synthase